ncbi:T9SS type A sorting domain-containing protein [Tenacibaculum sp. 1B UA]|uniref:T9SS type A sorting domain-containing protein n=1 Tax=Tenacibaculum sp. 1B UA TaxID=2922252 RepID=UPI002A2439C5|nr:T9SS type A sorting domain-containing protein [Tenacibaculum sp. 1B UA]MDX8553185.1 T9SS type A sorting domain-containing protein [Tenacibaculum sp. 1B UA]
MKKTTLLLFFIIFSFVPIALSQTVIYTEDFEGTDFNGYAIGNADTGTDYPSQTFVVSGPDRISRGTVGSFTFDGSITGNATNFIGGEDINFTTDGGFYNGHSYIELDPIDITSKSNLSIDIDVAFPNTSPTRYEINDFFIVDYKIDGGSYTTVLAFYGDGDTPTPTLGLRRDDNLNGILEGGETSNVNTAMTTFSLNLDAITGSAVSGNSIEIRVRFKMPDSQEEFAFDNIILKGSIGNTTPVIGGTSAGQTVNDNSTIAPFSNITTIDADGDNLSATITLDDNVKGLLSGTGLSGSGPYTITSTTPADLQTKLRALSYNPTDNRTTTTETTTFTVVINDGTDTDTDNTTTVISSAISPTVTSVNVPTNATYITGQNLNFTVNFNENITINTTGGIPQVAITVGSTVRQATYISGSGTNALVFRHTVLAGELDSDGIAVGTLTANGSTLKDSGGKDANLTLNSVGTTTNILVDAVAPTVTSVNVPANSTYISGQNLDFTVNFNENTIVNTAGGTPQIAITIGATTRQATYQNGSGTSALLFRYTVQAGDLDTDGIAIGALAVNGGTLKDAVNNDANLTLNSIGVTTAVLVDAVAPAVTSVNVPANATYIVGQNLDFTVNFNENVIVNTTGGTSQIAITIGATTRQATYLSGSGTSSLLFRYTIQAGDLDTDGITIGTLTANGGTLKDAASNDANLTLNSVGTTTGVLVDAVVPTVTSVNVPANETYLTGQNLDFTVNFDENVSVNTAGGTPQIAITIGATIRQATYQSGSGTNALLFRYTVQAGDLDTDGITIGTLAANGGTLKDAASNDVNLTLNSVGSTTAVLVGLQTITWTGTTNNDWNTASNWDLNVIPSTNTDIVIPSGLTNYPTASSAVTFNSLTIHNGASFIPQSTVTGTVTYKRSLPTTNWYLVSPPVVGETVQDIIANHTLASGTGGNLGLAPYSNITGPAWLYIQSSSTGTVTSGTGVSIKLASPGDVSVTGTINTSNVSKGITTGSRTNYNLIGNPYTSYINSASFTAANTAILTDEVIWLWDGTQYITKNAIDDIEIAPGQAFFVEAAANGNITFSSANQSHQNTDTFMRQEPIPSLELSVNNKEVKRSAKVFYASSKTTGYDKGYDSKMFGEDSSDLAVFTELLTNNQGKNLAIQTLPNTDHENMIIPVGIKGKAGKEITFSVTSKNLPANLKIYLEDRTNRVFTNLSEETYTITLANDTNGIGQFYLHTSSKKLETPPINPSLDNISIYSSSNNEVTIVGLQTKANVTVYSILGKEILNKNITSNGVSKISLSEVSSGVYIVKLNSDLGEITKKIILK